MRRAALAGGVTPMPLASGVTIVALAWGLAAVGHGMIAHMAAHMAVVAMAAPLIALGIAGSNADPSRRWPPLAAALPMSLLEAVVVWGWHLPAARALADRHGWATALEQAMFLGAGLLLWCACLNPAPDRRAAGVIALLLTTMHMTLLGALIALAPRPLYAMAHGGGAASLADQQIGGVVMLAIGGGAYLLGGLALLGGLLRTGSEARA